MYDPENPKTYIHLEMIARGQISGRIQDWPFIKYEALDLLAEVDYLRKELKNVSSVGEGNAAKD